MTPDTTDHISDDLISYVTGTTGYRYFDITPLYRDWYRNDANGNSLNFGVAIDYPHGLNGTNHYVEWVASQYNSSQCPRMVVNYVSHAGRQSWWQYESLGAGRAGTAYVDIYNGNLVYEHGDGGTTGNRMPVGLTHIYNSCLSASNPVGCGMGWRTSMHQSINKRTLASTNYYVWTDGSATEHYFPISGSQPYMDSEGMNLKLTTSGTTLTITDKGHNSMVFTVPTNETQQPLTKVTDSLGNTATLTYANGLLTQIADGVGRTIVLSYNSSNLLTSMVIPGRPSLTFSYTGSNLTGIYYSDVASGGTTFTYESGSNLMTSAKNYDGTQVTVAYEAASSYCEDAVDDYAQQVRRAISMEQTNGTTKGAKKLLEYLHMTTKVTAVESTTSNTGKTITYQFNTAGNVVCAYDELGYAVSNTFSDTVVNQQLAASKMRKVVINRITNIDFASSSAWAATKANSGDTVAQNTSTRCLNMPTLKITKTASGDTSHRLNVSITEAGTYTFSAYVKNTAALASGGLFVRIRSGSTVYTSRAVTAATTVINTDSAAEGWDRVYVSAVLPVGVVSLELVSTASTGTAYFACPQLETGSIPNHVNLLLNGDFSRTVANGTQTFASDWAASDGISTDARNGIIMHANAGLPAGLPGNAMQIFSYANTSSNSHCQFLPLKGNKNDVFVVGGWVNASSVYSGGDNKYKACLISRFMDTSGNWLSWQYHEFDVQRVGWKFAQWAVVAPANYTQVCIGVQYARNNNTAMFSNVFLHREVFGESFAYDDNGNVVSVATLAEQKSAMEYDDADNLTSYRQPGAADGVEHTMNYGSTAAQRKKHLLLTSTTPTGVRMAHSYDEYGNRTQTLNQVYGTSAYIQNNTTYANGNYVATQKDPRGNVVTYDIDAIDGTTTSITDPAGNVVSYGYDSTKRVTSVEAAAGAAGYLLNRNAYTYDKDRIASVSHNTTDDNTNDVTYTFGYDSLGRMTTVKVGSQSLSTNTYLGDRSNLLSRVSYGNGGSVQTIYDDFHRPIAIRHDGSTVNRYENEYGADGHVSFVRDNNLGRVLQTERDLAERPMGYQLRNADGSLIYRTAMDYDGQNRLVGFSEMTEDGTHKTTFAYDNDNRIVNSTFDGAAHQVIYSYDGLGRIALRTAANGTSFHSQYSYVPGGFSAGSTTYLVQSIDQGDFSLSYTYDSRGNIASVTRNGLTTTYGYNALGQLTMVDDPFDNASWIISYDRGGNIVHKSKYALDTGNMVKRYNYTYNSAWKDKLATFDGVSLTHDAIGNLTYDGTWSYTWQAGRQLKQMTKSGTTIQYQYDHNGLRVGKVVTASGVTTTTEYTLNGKLIAAMKQGSNRLHFFYDAQGRPAMVDFNGVIYTYAHSYQGDIIGILDNTGAAVVTYHYDAWGKPLATGGSMAATLGKLNPFRYRGYVYDEETGLYYLRSRYYNPTWSRFISSDTVMGEVGALGSHNLFAYCRNNPVMKFDPNGYFDLKSLYIVEYWLGKLLASIITEDKFGYTVMERWFNGMGQKVTITDNDEWNQFLLANKRFVNRIKQNAGAAVFNSTYTFNVKNEWLGLDLSDYGEGDYWSGYGLINGTNQQYGGFSVSGTVQHVENNLYHVVATYELNDYVDPGSYRLDKIYAEGARFLLGPCLDYHLQINGTVEFDFYYG